MVHLYALVRQPAALPDVAGIGDSSLRTVAVDDGIEAVVSDTTDGSARSDDAIMAHARVVEAVAEANDAVLPARFAGGTGSDADLSAQVVGRRERIVGALDRVQGCVELGLRVLHHDEGDASPPGSGREYMRRRLEQVEQAQGLANALHGRLTAISRESTCQVVASGDLVLTAAYLLPRTGVDRFRSALQAAQAEHGEVTLVLTGPWPPYSFALLEASGT